MKMPLSQHHRKVPGSLPLEQLWDSHPEPAATIWRMWCSDWSDLDHLITLTPLSGAAHWQQVGCLAVGSCLFFVIPCWQNPPRVLIIKFCCCLVIKSCLTLCDPMDGSPPVSSAHGISQARILEWVAISFSKGSSQPRDWTLISCTGRRFYTTEPPGKPHGYSYQFLIQIQKWVQLQLQAYKYRVIHAYRDIETSTDTNCSIYHVYMCLYTFIGKSWPHPSDFSWIPE